MNRLITVFFLLLPGYLVFGQGNFQDRREVIEQRVEAQLVAFITQRLDLTPEESTRFWPIYNEYREKERSLRRSARVEMQSGDLTDDEANALIQRQLDLEGQLLALKKEYIGKLRSAIPPRKIAKLQPAEQAFKLEILQRIRSRMDQGSRN